jgi:uncharacterized protein YndB with AHSA1/START domain
MNVTENIQASVRIAASPADVFPYLVDPELIVQWIGSAAELDPRTGGTFALTFPSTSVRGTYVCVEPPHRVVFTWGVPGDPVLPPGSSTVEILLVADGEETIVQLTHRDLPAEKREAHRGGWEECLATLNRVAGSRS